MACSHQNPLVLPLLTGARPSEAPDQCAPAVGTGGCLTVLFFGVEKDAMWPLSCSGEGTAPRREGMTEDRARFLPSPTAVAGRSDV